MHYSGRVQGVGFRYTARDIASDLGVLGWVKNLDDGQVEVVAEAEDKVLGSFLAQIQHYFSRYIRDTDIHWEPASGEFKDFIIRF